MNWSRDSSKILSEDFQKSVWQLRYWAIFSGQALSLIGSALTQFVLLWWITDTTGSVSSLGMAGLAALLPQALLSPLGGTFADRYSRRVIMVAADLVSAACMVVLIGLFLYDNIALWHLYLMMALRSSMQAFQQPAPFAEFVPQAGILLSTRPALGNRVKEQRGDAEKSGGHVETQCPAYGHSTDRQNSQGSCANQHYTRERLIEPGGP